MRTVSIYSTIRIPNAWRAKRTPRVHRKFRPIVIARTGPFAFYRNRFYELDPWYKARIAKPPLLPQMHVIDPDRIAKSFEERMQPNLPKAVNIGFKRSAAAKNDGTVEGRIDNREQLERMARKNQLRIDLERIESNLLAAANHHNVFEDLFVPGVYFHNTQGLDVNFGGNAGSVCFGNCVEAASTTRQPHVTIEKICEDGGGEGHDPKATHSSANHLDTFNSMLMLNLDGNGFVDAAVDSVHAGTAVAKARVEGEEGARIQLIHWMVANVPGKSAELEEGELIVPYLQPLPFYGTGYHRVAFLLLRHRERIDFSSYRVDSRELLGRRFEMNRFIKTHEEKVTPSAISFCQVQWDESVDNALRNMGLKSPRYWYEWDAPLTMKQREFPLKPMPFNHYLDMFRPPALVRKQVQREKLEELVKLPPGTKHLAKPKYPDIFYAEHKKEAIPPWLHQQLIKKNSGRGVYATLYQDYANPATQHIEKSGESGGEAALLQGISSIRLGQS